MYVYFYEFIVGVYRKKSLLKLKKFLEDLSCFGVRGNFFSDKEIFLDK